MGWCLEFPQDLLHKSEIGVLVLEGDIDQEKESIGALQRLERALAQEAACVIGGAEEARRVNKRNLRSAILFDGGDVEASGLRLRRDCGDFLSQEVVQEGRLPRIRRATKRDGAKALRLMGRRVFGGRGV